jgi:hypothetical protein
MEQGRLLCPPNEKGQITKLGIYASHPEHEIYLTHRDITE